MGASGNPFSALFGGGYEAPTAPSVDPAPLRSEKDPEEKSVRDAERRKLRARANGINGTLLERATLGGISANSLLGSALKQQG